MNPNKQKIDLAIIQLTAQLGKLPEVWQIEEVTGFNAILIIRNLDKDYPKNLLMSQTERTALEAYLECGTIKLAAEKLGKSYITTSNTITRSIQKGFLKEKIKTKKYEKSVEHTTFIEVTSDFIIKLNKNTSVNLKGGRGYVDPTTKNSCVVYKNCKEYHVTLFESQYRVVRRAIE